MEELWTNVSLLRARPQRAAPGQRRLASRRSRARLPGPSDCPAAQRRGACRRAPPSSGAGGGSPGGDRRDHRCERGCLYSGRMSGLSTAVVLTVGNEIVSGDTENTNASWLCRRLASLGVEVKLVAAVRDDIDEIAALLRAERTRADYVFVTGGLGGTPDDVTRDAVAAAFGVPCEEIE